jgi:hypothetical protein
MLRLIIVHLSDLWRFRSAAGGAPVLAKTWGFSKSDRQRSACMPFSSYGKIAVRQFLIDTLRAFCESQIRASCQGLIVHHHPIIQVALDAVGVFQMSESKRAQIVEQSIVLLDRVLSNSSGQTVFDNQGLS